MAQIPQNLTDGSLKKLLPRNNKRTLYSDPIRKGFYVEVSAGGNVSFLYRYQQEGSAKKYGLGKHPSTTLLQARTKWLEAQHAVSEGKDVTLGIYTDEETNFEKITIDEIFSQLCEEDLADSMKSTTLNTAKNNYQNHIMNGIGHMPINDVNSIPLINKYVIEPVSSKGMARMPNVIFTLLSQIWRFAEVKGYLGKNPYQPFNSMNRPIKKENKGSRVLDDAEIKIFWNGMDGMNQMDPLTRLGLKLLLVTAVRKNELLTAEWKDIDLNTGCWTIPAEHAKSGVEWNVALSPLAVELFEDAKLLHKRVRAMPLGRNTLDQWLLRGHERLNLDKFTPHDLRRTNRTLMAQLGVPYHTAEKALDHKLRASSIEETYNKYDYFEERQEASLLVSNHIRGLI